MPQLLFTTHPGMEGLVGDELREVLGASEVEVRPGGFLGRVRATVPGSLAAASRTARTLRSVHHVSRFVDAFALPDDEPLEAIRARVGELDIEELSDRPTFRVRTRRVGAHPYRSMDVERIAGGEIAERYGAPVRLDDPEVTVRVDVRGRFCSVGVELTDRPLSLRHRRRPFSQRTSLKSTIAWAALRLAELPDGPFALLDPFCGAGTILLEAADIRGDAFLCGSDRRQEAADGTRANLEAAGHGPRSEVHCSDARSFGEGFGDRVFDAVVTNPPFGARLGRRLHFASFYRAFLEHLSPRLANGGPAVVLTLRVNPLREAARATGFREERILSLSAGGASPSIVVLRKTSSPPRRTRRSADR